MVRKLEVTGTRPVVMLPQETPGTRGRIVPRGCLPAKSIGGSALGTSGGAPAGPAAGPKTFAPRGRKG